MPSERSGKEREPGLAGPQSSPCRPEGPRPGRVQRITRRGPLAPPPPLGDWLDRWAVLGSHWHKSGALPWSLISGLSAGAEAVGARGWVSARCLAPMADQEVFVAQQQQQPPPLADVDNGMLDGVEEDPAAAFLAQQENEIAGIENDVGVLEGGEVLATMQNPGGLGLGTRGGRAEGVPRREPRCPAGGAGSSGIPAWRGFPCPSEGP